MSPSICPTNGTAAAAAPRPPVDWSKAALGSTPAPTMFIASWAPETGRWDGGRLVPYGPLALLPAAQVLNYGQSIFEGLKAYRAPTAATATPANSPCGGGAAPAPPGGEAGCGGPGVLLFRPEANAERFEAGALRMCMPPVPRPMFLAALQAVCRANADWVPPASRGSLYLRPLLLGTGPLLGLCPAPSYTFVLYAVPVGGRAKEGRLTALDYLIHPLHRAAPRGVGATKAAGNYSPCLAAQAQARKLGCHDCIYLDARSDTYLEEGSGCNVFAARGGVLTTPPAAGSILPGITRASLLTLAAALGYSVREAGITVAEAMQADEMFSSGTAVVVQPIGSITYKGRKTSFCRGPPPADAGAASAPGAEEPHGNGHAAAVAPGGACNGNGNGHAHGGGDAAATTTTTTTTTTVTTTISGTATTTTTITTTNGCAGGDGDTTSHSCADVDTMSYRYVSTAAVALTCEQRAALAAAAPQPEASELPPGVGPIAQRLYCLLTAIQSGRAPDPYGWAVQVEMEGPTEGPLHLDELLGLYPVDEQEYDEGEGQEEVEGDATAVVRPAGCGAQLPAAAKALRSGARVAAGRSVFADPNLE